MLRLNPARARPQGIARGRDVARHPGTLGRKLTPCLDFSSVLRGEDMILRRTEEGAEKCALRDLRRLELTVVEYFMADCRSSQHDAPRT